MSQLLLNCSKRMLRKKRSLPALYAIKKFSTAHLISVHKSNNNRKDADGNLITVTKHCIDYATHRRSKACKRAQEENIEAITEDHLLCKSSHFNVVLT